MKYFKNSELVKLYNVSDKAVRNWIEGAQKGTSGLELFERNGKPYIADTIKNNILLDQLVEKGKKYRNSRSYRKLEPTLEFYSIFSHAQIVEMINEMEIHKEFPLHFRYFGYGATHWDDYLHKLYQAGSRNNLTSSYELFHLSKGYIDHLIAAYENVNVVDVGVGNGLAAKEVLGHALATGKLKKYIGIDISQALLDITERNIKNWFSGAIAVEKHTRNIINDRFEDILCSTSYGKDASKTLNLVLFQGGTVYNFREPSRVLSTIRDSIGKDGVLLTTLRLDSKAGRRFFDFNTDSEGRLILTRHAEFLLELLNIDGSMYETEQFFDEQKRSRFIRVRFKIGFSIKFKIGNFEKTVDFQKGDILLLYRGRHFTDQEIADTYTATGFRNIQVTVTDDDQPYIMLISKAHRS